MAKGSDGAARAARRPRWLDRRRLYTGGAMMILAPLGLTGCPGDGDKDKSDVPSDIVADRPDMPDGWVDPEVIAIAPPFDPGPVDAWPELIAIAPFDPGPADLSPDVIAIAPFDPGPDVTPVPPSGGFQAACVVDGDCSQEYYCTNEAICIVAVPGCGIPACMPKACGASDACPDGSTCLPYDNKSAGSTMKTCVRQPTKVAGGYWAPCASDAACTSPQQFCRDGCPADTFCIVATEVCLPIVCDPAGTPCPDGSTCANVGITTACVKSP